jgi:hypothetical protein
MCSGPWRTDSLLRRAYLSADTILGNSRPQLCATPTFPVNLWVQSLVAKQGIWP